VGADVGTKERRAREKEVLRREILSAARELFVKEGYQHVSMRRIAEKIDYSPTTIYLYFEDKEQLLHAICEETFTKLVKQFEEIVTTTSDPIECLKKAGRAYIEFGLRYPDQYRLTFMGPRQPRVGDVNFDYQGSMGEKCFLSLRGIVEECVRNNRIRSLNVEATSQVLWANVHGITSLLISHELFPWVNKEELINETVDLMTRGLRP